MAGSAELDARGSRETPPRASWHRMSEKGSVGPGMAANDSVLDAVPGLRAPALGAKILGSGVSVRRLLLRDNLMVPLAPRRMLSGSATKAAQ